MYETRDVNLMHEMFSQYEYLVPRSYLSELSCLPFLMPPCYSKAIQLLKVEWLPETTTYRHFTYILNALAALNETIGCILISKCGKLSLYLGVKGNCDFSLRLFQNGFTQTFPTSKISPVSNSAKFLDDLFNPCNYSCLTSSLVTLNSSYESNFLKDFTELIGTQENYVAFFLAEPMSSCKVRETKNQLYEIYDVLSHFSQSNYTYYKSDAKTVSCSTSEAKTSNSSQSNTRTCSEGTSKACSAYTNLSVSTPLSLGPLKIPHEHSHSNTPISSTNPSILTTTNTPSADVSSSRASPKNINSNLLVNKGNSNSCSANFSDANAATCGNSICHTTTRGNTMNHTNYQALSFSCPNKRLQEAIILINETITRYNALSKGASFHFSAYFFSCYSEVSMRAAYTYTGLSASSYALSPNQVNSWASNHPDYACIYKSLRSFTTPTFSLTDSELLAYNATPLLSDELINTLYLPIASPFLTPP